jgi:hypothetical protein
MHKVKTRNRLDLIDCWGLQSAIALHLYKGGGLDPLQTVSRANPTVLGKKSRDNLGTLTDSTHARTIRIVDRPASGLDRPRCHFLCSTYAPCLLVEVDKPKAYELSLI